MTSFYDSVGGDKTFRKLVHEFYKQVPDDEILAPMYPENDFEGAEDRLRWFLAQFWGGPQDFTKHRGAPMLRARHQMYLIDRDAADRWLELMGNALKTVDEETMPPEFRQALWSHMERVADMLINVPD